MELKHDKAFEAWCGQHKMHPNNCFELHHADELAEQEYLKAIDSFTEKCEHDIPMTRTCVLCKHEYLQEMGELDAEHQGST